MIVLSPTDSRPLYEQIVEKLKTLIIGGYLLENDKIPSVRELASELTINPNTIQKAYKLLENEGYIYSKTAKGYFVCAKNNNDARKNSLIDSLYETVKELKFLGFEARQLKDIIEKIYGKEDNNECNKD